MDQPAGGAAAGSEVGALRQQLQQAQQQAWRAQDALNQVALPFWGRNCLKRRTTCVTESVSSKR